MVGDGRKQEEVGEVNGGGASKTMHEPNQEGVRSRCGSRRANFRHHRCGIDDNRQTDASYAGRAYRSRRMSSTDIPPNHAAAGARLVARRKESTQARASAGRCSCRHCAISRSPAP
jgi:hypothetical protein